MRNEVCNFLADFPRPSMDEFARAASGLRQALSASPTHQSRHCVAFRAGTIVLRLGFALWFSGVRLTSFLRARRLATVLCPFMATRLPPHSHATPTVPVPAGTPANGCISHIVMPAVGCAFASFSATRCASRLFWTCMTMARRVLMLDVA